MSGGGSARQRTLTPALVGVLGVLTLVRLVMAARVPLAPDEAYYWIWSRALAPGYFDHPPMIALWIRAGTWLLGDNPLGVRLLGPLSVAGGSWFLADAAERLFPDRGAGVTAAALANATILMGVGAIIMTPDTPLLFFWTMTLWALARAVTCSPARKPGAMVAKPSVLRVPGGRMPSENRGGIRNSAELDPRGLASAPIRLADGGVWWLIAGIAAGLALVSKYTAVFLWPGALIPLLWVPALRPWLRRAAHWVGAIAGFLLFLPVIWWNSEHHWAGFLRQGGRVGDWHPERAYVFLGDLVGSQLGLVTPIIFVLCCVGLWVAWRRAWRDRDVASVLLTGLSLPAVILFLQHAIGGRVLGNWPAVIYPAGWVAVAGLSPSWQKLRSAALTLGGIMVGAVYLLALVPWTPTTPRLNPIARQLGGWKDLASEVEAARIKAGATFVVAGGYALPAELAWSLPPGTVVVGTDPRWQLFTLRVAHLAGATGLAVAPARYGTPRAWGSIAPAGDLTRARGFHYRVYRVHGLRSGHHAMALPRADAR